MRRFILSVTIRLWVLLYNNISWSIVSFSFFTACTFSTPHLPLSVHCSRFRCRAGWLMVNLGLGPGGERGEEAAAMKKRWHFTAIIHPCFVPAALRSVCTGMECRAEGCWDGGMNGAGCGGKRGGRGVIGGFERWRSHGVKMWDTYEDRIRETKASVFLTHYLWLLILMIFFFLLSSLVS